MAASEHFTSTISAGDRTASRNDSISTRYYRLNQKYLFLEASIDALTCSLGVLIGSLLPKAIFSSRRSISLGTIAAISLVSGLLSTSISWRANACQRSWNPLRIHNTELALRLTVQSILFFGVFSYLASMTIDLESLIVILILLPVLLINQKLILDFLLNEIYLSKRHTSSKQSFSDGPHVKVQELSYPLTFNTSRLHVALKRLIDLFISFVLLLSLLPLFLLISLIIWIDSTGPIFFVQKRVGKKGKIFHIYKFRSMYYDSPHYDLSPIKPSDCRITRIGRLLRKTSFDELPQLINVLLGEMSLVGPRPEMPFIVDGYTHHHRQRLLVTPGITGLWQLSADRTAPIHKNLHYDFHYIQNQTFFMDLAILIHTLFFAARGV